jgi:ATP-binding cassette, subfamily B, bacterial
LTQTVKPRVFQQDAAGGYNTGLMNRLFPLKHLLPFCRPYLGRFLLAFIFLCIAASATLAIPYAFRNLIDQGFVQKTVGAAAGDMGSIRIYFISLFGIACVLAVFTAARFYMVSWLGERVTADLRRAVYGRMLLQSPAFFETTQTGEVLSRLTTDTTLVQTVIGASVTNIFLSEDSRPSLYIHPIDVFVTSTAYF